MCGSSGNASDITITDSEITATSTRGAGIGGGWEGTGNNITIIGGKVTANPTGTSADDSDIVVEGSEIGDGGNGGDMETHSSGFCTELDGIKGEAIIEAKTITDQSGKANWQGIIHMTDDKEWVIGGEQSYDQDIEVENEETMTINANTNFTQQASLANNGTIKIPTDSKILCSGTFKNEETAKANIYGELNITGAANWNGTEVTGGSKITPTAAKIPATITMKENLDKVYDGQPADK